MSQGGQGDIQERIAAARREAESLKEKIRAKKESSADTSRKSALSYPFHALLILWPQFALWLLKLMLSHES